MSTRPLISSGDALDYLKSFAGLEPNVSRSGKTADLTARYRSMLASRRVEDYLRLIKEIHVRQKEMAQRKKRLGQADGQYLKLAERIVCEEFAAVLNTTPEFIRQRLYAEEWQSEANHPSPFRISITYYLQEARSLVLRAIFMLWR